MRLHEALGERVAMSRIGSQLGMVLAPRIDKFVIPRTNGRLSVAGANRTGLVTTTGAKSGKPRTNPLTLIEDSDGLLAVGSNYGRPSHPGWSANLVAHPECTIEYKGPPRQYRAELLSGQARADAWAKAVDFFAGYEAYREKCAPREIRVFRLRPVEG
ncbi:MAG: nitroreductase family deazaflavin-dependent oxidoreductase [Mycobacterium sp.]|nr:MAG: nitroreductase family deazaflavin-dependent oxidoreductase [Mycobacterium sp.]